MMELEPVRTNLNLMISLEIKQGLWAFKEFVEGGLL